MNRTPLYAPSTINLLRPSTLDLRPSTAFRSELFPPSGSAILAPRPLLLASKK